MASILVDMPFVEYKVYPVKVVLTCEKCRGEMKFTGEIFPTGKPGYAHECKCGHREIHNKSYPVIEYRSPQFKPTVTDFLP